MKGAEYGRHLDEILSIWKDTVSPFYFGMTLEGKVGGTRGFGPYGEKSMPLYKVHGKEHRWRFTVGGSESREKRGIRRHLLEEEETMLSKVSREYWITLTLMHLWWSHFQEWHMEYTSLSREGWKSKLMPSGQKAISPHCFPNIDMTRP